MIPGAGCLWFHSPKVGEGLRLLLVELNQVSREVLCLLLLLEEVEERTNHVLVMQDCPYVVVVGDEPESRRST